MNNTTCYYIFAFAVLLALQSPSQANTISTSLATDQYALLALKSHITPHSHGHAILSTNWTNSTSVCSWIGVTCGSRHRRVTALNLRNMSLSGNIPPHFGNISFLVSLDLSYNHFRGSLPQELSLLHRLKYVSLHVNNFTGEIPPWFGHLSKLERLSLHNNSFIGSIPKTLSNLSNLQVLDFTSNSVQGEIPEEMGRLQSLKLVYLDFNKLTGAIPSAIFNISSLESLDLTSNELDGGLPMDICTNLPFIEEIFISLNQLSGQIPSNLSHCTRLGILSLSYNSFSGRIPSAIGTLESLKFLALGGNQLNGDIPQEIGNLGNLNQLTIERNKLTGSLPLNVFKNMSSSLQIISLAHNKLSGNLSPEIGNFTMLNSLYLRDNNFTGVLPREIGQLEQLEILQLDTNAFNGPIPSEMFNVSTLVQVALNNAGVSGALPDNLCYNTPFLEGLYLGNNSLTGPIPTSIYNCKRLTYLDLSYNTFSGYVPHFFGNLSHLENLKLTRNNLTTESSSSSGFSFITSLANCRSLKTFGIADNPLDAVIPSSIGNLSSSLENIFLYNCNIKGRIPSHIGNLTNLIKLELFDNQLSGSIPPTLVHMRKLQALVLNNNKLIGSIPEWVCQFPSLFSLLLHQNQLSGVIPECLGDVSSLGQLHLESNMLTSFIPSSLWRLQNLLEMDMSSNFLTGFLPPEIGNLVAVVYLNLSMNRLSHSIPSNIGGLQRVATLSLAHNRFEGPIPESVGSMISLEELDLSYNSFSGSIPESMEKLKQLNYFNVSFNSLSGQIPTGGPFRYFTKDSFIGNKALCGIQIERCNANSNHMSRRKIVELALFVVAGAIVLVTFVALAFILLRRRKKDKKRSAGDVLEPPAVERISYYEILHATEQFSESNILGVGSLGTVYRGTLRDGRIVAVKVFNLQTEAAFRSFDVECQVLRSLRHRNLIEVISSCSNEDFKALILEYLPNGSLEKWLYSHNYCLDVVQRLNIMTDVACALEYLHHGYSTPIVHCDLKPSNVLLDEDMVAHVGDFGIAKLLGDEDSTVITKTLATLGYIAPEYGLEGLVSTSCDVYSFGLMLMETFTRKRPSDDMFAENLSLKSWVESSLPQCLDQVIDVNLFVNLNDERCHKIMHCVSSVLVLALKCSAESPRDRINMKEALSELLHIKRQFDLPHRSKT